MPDGCERDEDRRDERGGGGVRERPDIRADVHRIDDVVEGRPRGRRDDARDPGCEDPSRRGACGRDQRALGQHLRGNPRPPRAERQPHADLHPASRRAREHERRDVRRRHRHQQRHEAEDESRAAPDRPPERGGTPNPVAGIDDRRGRSPAAGRRPDDGRGGVEPRPRLVPRDVRSHPAHRAEHWHARRIHRSRHAREVGGRDPDVGRDEPRRADEPDRRNTDDGNRAAVQARDAAHARRVAAETAQPQRVADHRLRRRVFAIHVRVKEAAGGRRHLQRVEVVAADELRFDHLRSVADRQADGQERPGEERDEIPRARRELAVLGERERPRAAAIGVLERDHDEPIGRLERQRRAGSAR